MTQKSYFENNPTETSYYVDSYDVIPHRSTWKDMSPAAQLDLKMKLNNYMRGLSDEEKSQAGTYKLGISYLESLINQGQQSR